MNFDLTASCVARYCMKANTGKLLRATKSHDKSCLVYVGIHSMFALSWQFTENFDAYRVVRMQRTRKVCI